MARNISQATSHDAFAIYCGDGRYLTEYAQFTVEGGRFGKPAAVAIQTTIGPVSDALAASRAVAVGALHAARRAGLSAWLVPHPGAMQARNAGAMQ